MLNFSSVRIIYPEEVFEVKVKSVPKERAATKKSKIRQKKVLTLVKNRPLGISALVKSVGCKREQMRYDVRTMIARGELINLNSGKSPYLVRAA